MIYIAFFFLFYPSEHPGTTNNDAAAFTLDIMFLYLGNKKLNLSTAATKLELSESTCCTCALHLFTTQKI